MATKLTSPQGVAVSVDDAAVDGLLARGFTKGETKKAPAKKAAPSNESKK